MDITQILTTLTGTPLAFVLLWLLVKAQAEATEARRLRDADNQRWADKCQEMTERVIAALEAFNEHMDK